MWVSATSAAAQTPTAPTLKAAFLYNFAKFTEWPTDALAVGQKLMLCVMGDASVADALDRTIEGRHLEGHPLTVRIVGMDDPIGSCHLLYASGLDKRRSKQLFQALTGPAVFTVSDGDDFAESGGVAQLILEGDRMRFAVNITAARRARLTLSSKLLRLATIIKDQRDVQHY
jgi:hypothetical protein